MNLKELGTDMAKTTETLQQEVNRLKAELEVAKTGFENFIESSPDGVLFLDAEKNIRFANRAAARMFACPAESLIDIRFEYQANPGEIIEVTIPRIDGNKAVVEMHMAVSVWGEYAFVVSLRDVTSRKQAERELRQSHAQYKSLYSLVRLMCDTVPDLIWAKDLDGKYIFANKAICEKLLGAVDTDEPIGKTDVFFAKRQRQSHPENPRWHTFGELCFDTDRVVIVSGKPGRFDEYGNVYGEFLFLDVYKTPLWDENGCMIGTVGSARIVTQEKELEKEREQALVRHQQSEKALSTILDSVPFGIVIIDKEKKIRRTNRGALQIMGYDSEQEIVGSSCQNSLCVTGNGSCPMLDTGTKFLSVETQIGTKDGCRVSVLKSAVLVSINDEDVLIETFIDITDHKKAEEALALSERNMSAILESISVAVISIDADGTVVSANRAAEHIFGYPTQEIIGKPFETLVPQQLWKKHSFNVQDLFDKPDHLPVAKKSYGLRKDGTEFPAEISVSTVVVTGSTLLTIMIADITERERMQDQILRSQRMESIGLLASGIAHDMNNILTPILTGSELMHEYVQNPVAVKSLDIITKSAKRAADLVQQLLTFARGHVGKIATLELGHLISEVKRLVQRTFPKTIILEFSVQKELHLVSIDPTQMHQVLMNLLVNARDAMPNGGTVNVFAENIIIDKHNAAMNHEVEEGHYVLLTVTDTGSGIHPDLLPKIFEPFFTTKQMGQGTGLGLATVYSIIYKNGGFIEVSSQVGEGTTFKVFLPAIFNDLPEGNLTVANVAYKGNNELILVVDDEEAIREITAEILTNNGYRVICASDGTDAVSMFIQYKDEVKAVILDMMMPIMDGPATFHSLRMINPTIQAIGVSGLMDADAIANKTGDAISAVLTKPYKSQQLFEALHSIIYPNGIKVLDKS